MTYSSVIKALQHIDLNAFKAINSLGTPLLDPIMLIISNRTTWWALAILITLFLLWKKKLRLFYAWLLILIAIGVSDFLTYYLLKGYFQRIRPCYALEGVRLVQTSCGSRYGFPSNHAANSMAAAVMLYCTVRRNISLSIFLLAVLVGLSRVYLGVHFPLDIVAGFVEGAIVSLLLFQIARFTTPLTKS